MIVDVAAGVIERADGAFLLAQRPAGKVYAGWWEFPGGKIQTGESAEAALARELHEELGIDVQLAYPWITRVHAYAHATVRLRFFRVVRWTGDPHPRENQSFVWQTPGASMAEPMLPANAPVLAALALPLEYAITSAATLGVEAMLAKLEARLAAGLELVQVREPPSVGEEFTRKAIELAHRRGARVLTKTRVAAADGIHFTAGELMALEARPQGTLAAASCHTREELDRAMQLELDFAVLGPVRVTASHPANRPLGWEGFGQLARGASIPVYAIGGVTRADLERARSCGGHGLAMIRGSWLEIE
ncbi:MAG: DNA mismatch repair protein MutT [Betaproteobacteria bacterium RIFCSPLOWO2_02_FULL_68_150]|nr:MAG: DNA mismatch repair protein MutT [Betaproteobacteria bacterium RIFCSPLOWO2_02_FULL_68_150]